MRYFTFSVGARLVAELDIAGAVDDILHDGRDIIQVRLIDGAVLMIHLIDSAIPLYEIKNTLRDNEANGYYTLFILWSDMLLPDDGRRIATEDWQDALLALYGGCIYAYKVRPHELYVFPVYFEALANTRYRRVVYGEPVAIGAISTGTARAGAPLDGTFHVAEFAGDPDAYHRQRARQLDPTPEDALDGYYAVLGVSTDADIPTIKAAFRQKARENHPDLNADDPQAHARMQEINVAYEVILRAREE